MVSEVIIGPGVLSEAEKLAPGALEINGVAEVVGLRVTAISKLMTNLKKQ